MVSRLRAIIAASTFLLCVAVLGETEPEESEPTREKSSMADEKQSESENQPEDGAKSDAKVDDEPSLNDKETTDSEASETYTRLPVQTRINPNQNVALPQDI